MQSLLVSSDNLSLVLRGLLVIIIDVERNPFGRGWSAES
jgi:hypothetical protein